VLLEGAISGCEVHVTYLLLPRVANVLVGLKKGSDINCLSPPDMSVDSPVQGELQRTPVERSMKIEVSAGRTCSLTEPVTYVTALTDIMSQKSWRYRNENVNGPVWINDTARIVA
jgi:hypothetical protein